MNKGYLLNIYSIGVSVGYGVAIIAFLFYFKHDSLSVFIATTLAIILLHLYSLVIFLTMKGGIKDGSK